MQNHLQQIWGKRDIYARSPLTTKQPAKAGFSIDLAAACVRPRPLQGSARLLPARNGWSWLVPGWVRQSEAILTSLEWYQTVAGNPRQLKTVRDSPRQCRELSGSPRQCDPVKPAGTVSPSTTQLSAVYMQYSLHLVQSVYHSGVKTVLNSFENTVFPVEQS